ALDRQGTALELLTRRHDEDRLSEKVYAALPYPESQLVALAHSLIARNVIDEADSAVRRGRSASGWKPARPSGSFRPL
ncbi:MAG TPA: hypothetical protein VMD50_04520, partial [Mycobacterium sp.]|nr:hypothetical protein [Mycobacterium sp.]